jgi:hypothetical protein
MIFAGARVGMVNEPLAEYRVRSTSLASDRTRQFQAYVAVLEKAAARCDLTVEERGVVQRSLSVYQCRLALQEAQTALIERRPRARRLALDVAKKHSFPPTVRLGAALAAAFPGVARWRLVRRGRELASGVRV